MALAPLATVADLSDRGVDVTNLSLAGSQLEAASEAIREAAGSPISEVTSTVTLRAPEGQWLRLPQPATAVTSVTVDGEAVTDYTLSDGELWRAAGWRGSSCDLALVVVSFTHGFLEIPSDIVDLVCMFAAAGMAQASQGSHAGKAYESIDDYRVGYTQGEDATASAMEVPERTARMLRARFGGGTYVTGERS